MSMRRVQGRFTTTSATEAFQRQLAAPAKKWKKAWVTPNGLAPESSYKICKWVQVEHNDDEDDGFSQAGDDDDFADDVEDSGTPLDVTEASTPLATPVDEPGPAQTPLPSSALANPPLTAASASPNPVPTNAIEMSNVAPGHVEEGQGDLGGNEVHLTVESAPPADAGEPTSEDVVMGEDTGLVHGEVDPPQEALAVEGGDHPPPETES